MLDFLVVKDAWMFINLKINGMENKISDIIHSISPLEKGLTGMKHASFLNIFIYW